MAQRLLRANDDLCPLGKKWGTTFIQRNPRVSSIIGQRVKASRIIGTSPEHIQDFFTRLSRVQAEHQVRAENMWNMDEYGIALGICTNTKVLANAKKKHTYVVAPQDREWVSIVESIFTAGRKIRPFVIFPGAAPQSTWLEEKVLDWVITTSENGWTANQIVIRWLTDIFLPETKPSGGRG